jgi:hypothetical protein
LAANGFSRLHSINLTVFSWPDPAKQAPTGALSAHMSFEFDKNGQES